MPTNINQQGTTPIQRLHNHFHLHNDLAEECKDKAARTRVDADKIQYSQLANLHILIASLFKIAAEVSLAIASEIGRED